MRGEKRKRETTVSEADKALKSLRMYGQASSASPSDSRESSPGTTSSSDSDGKGGRCHHVYLDSDDVDMAVYDIRNSEELPTCGYPRCRITWKGAGESKEGMMQCIECRFISCAGWPAVREDPQGHARLHAADLKHYVAQWYDEPKLGYCFECACVMRLSDTRDQSSDDEWSDKDREVKDDLGMVASKTTDQRGVVESKSKVDCAMVVSNSKVDSAMAASNSMDQRGMVARDYMSGYATGDGYVIRGMPNHGNTCYMNASLQCLLALGKMRTRILRPDARLGDIGLELKQLFVETSSVNNAARHMLELDPHAIVVYMRSLHKERFKERVMGDSHEFLLSLRSALDCEVMDLNLPHVVQGGVGVEVFDAFGESIFKGQQIQTVSCKSCSYNLVKHIDFNELILPLPQKVPPAPARSVASPPRNKSHRSAAKICKKLFQQINESDGAMERTLKPLQVDSSEVKDVIKSRLQMKNDPPRETIEVPMKLDFIPNLFDDAEEMEESTADSHNPQYKEKAQSSDIVHDEPEHMKSLASIDSCLTLFSHQLIDCVNCSKVAEVPKTNESKNVEPIMANTNVNAAIDGDQTELPDRKTCPNEQSSDFSSLSVESPSRQPYPSGSFLQLLLSEDITAEDITSGTSCGEKDLASCSTANEKAESHDIDGAALSCLPTDKQTDQLSAQDIHDTSTQKQASGNQLTCDNSAQQVAERQHKHTDGNGDAIQTQVISNLPAVLVIQLLRFNQDLSKLKGHVSFKEILHLGPFMVPSYVDKDKCIYRLVGVIEHLGDRLDRGHYVAYVRGSRPSSWVCADDLIIREVSLEQVLGREAYILFYERIEG